MRCAWYTVIAAFGCLAMLAAVGSPAQAHHGPKAVSCVTYVKHPVYQRAGTACVYRAEDYPNYRGWGGMITPACAPVLPQDAGVIHDPGIGYCMGMRSVDAWLWRSSVRRWEKSTVMEGRVYLRPGSPGWRYVYPAQVDATGRDNWYAVRPAELVIVTWNPSS